MRLLPFYLKYFCDNSNKIGNTQVMTEETKIEILLKDYDLTNQKIEKFVGNQFFLTQGALALIGGYIIFLIEGANFFDLSTNSDLAGESTKYYLQFLPFLALIIVSGIGYQYQRTIGLQGYKHYLELIINEKAGENLISYGHIGMKFMLKGSALAIVNFASVGLLCFGTIALAFFKPEVEIGYWFLAFHIFIFASFTILAFKLFNGYPEKVKKAALKIYESKNLRVNEVHISERILKEYTYGK